MLTVEVERVWKGMAAKSMTLYQSHEGVTASQTDYVDDCMSKPVSSFNLAELGDSTSPQQ